MPAIIFDRLPEDHVVQMFVTINAKHTRLNASHLVSLSGRQLYRDDALAAAHDVVRALNDREDSPLHGEIKLLGVGRGRVAQAPLAQELKKLFASDAFGGPRKSADFREDSEEFFVNYFKQVSVVFGAAWGGRKYSIKSATALRAFIRVAPDVVRRLDQEHADRSDFRAIGRVIAPWGRRIGDLRFETEGAWKRSGTTVESLGAGAEAGAGVSGRGGWRLGASRRKTGRDARKRPVLECRPGSPQHLRLRAVNHRPTLASRATGVPHVFAGKPRLQPGRAFKNVARITGVYRWQACAIDLNADVGEGAIGGGSGRTRT